MICPATAQGNDMVHLHSGVDVAASCARAASQNRAHIGQRNFSNGQVSRAPSVAGVSGDGFGPFGIVPSPLKNVLIESIGVLFAILSHLLSVLLGMLHSPSLRAIFGFLCVFGFFVAGFAALSENFTVFGALLSALLLDLFALGCSVLYAVQPFLLAIVLAPSLLVCAILVWIGQLPRFRTLALADNLGARRWFRVIFFHVDNLLFPAGKASRINTV